MRWSCVALQNKNHPCDVKEKVTKYTGLICGLVGVSKNEQCLYLFIMVWKGPDKDAVNKHHSPPLTLPLSISLSLCLSLFVSLSLFLSVSLCLSLSLFLSLSLPRSLTATFMTPCCYWPTPSTGSWKTESGTAWPAWRRSEEHTSELQSR